MVSLAGDGTYVLTNRGTISRTTDSQNGNQHTLTSVFYASNIVVNNYGSIEALTGINGKCSYALLFYNGCDVTFNAYSGSSVECEVNGYVLVCGSVQSFVLNYEDGASLINGGVSKAYTSLASNKVTVNHIN